MMVRVLLQTSLLLWLAQESLQGGVQPQSVSWGRGLPARGVGVGMKPGDVGGALGAVGNRYGSKAMKAGMGRYAGAQLGLGGYRTLGLGGRAGLRQGGYGAQGVYGGGLGTGMGLGTGYTNGHGLGLGQAGKRVYGTGLGTLPGYGAMGGIGYPGVRPGLVQRYPSGLASKQQKAGYFGGVGNYQGAGLGPVGYGAALGQGGYLGGAAGKLAAGYGDGITGYLGAMEGNGLGYGNAYGDAYGAGLGYPADLAVGLENKAGKSEALGTGLAAPLQGAYGAAQVPFANAPALPAGLEGDGGYPYNGQQLSLTAEGAKSASKYEAGAGFGAQPAGFGAPLGPAQDVLGEQTGKYSGVNAALGNAYKA